MQTKPIDQNWSSARIADILTILEPIAQPAPLWYNLQRTEIALTSKDEPKRN
jgi:hypothetical protein